MMKAPDVADCRGDEQAGGMTPNDLDEPIPAPVQEADRLAERLASVRRSVQAVIFGQELVVEQALVSLLSGGHTLLVGAPGLGKTLLVETLGQVLGLSARRVQFTPDLMPADIIGSEVLDEDPVERGGSGRRSFRFVPGPVFCQFLMADEINRASPRTQSALLQAMQEGRVAVAGVDRPLPRPFHVLATQNPIEQEGTYPLPEAQLDRFLLQIDLTYPAAIDERAMLIATTGQARVPPSAVLRSDELIEAQSLVRRLPVGDAVVDAIVRLVREARPESASETAIKRHVAWGPGPRAAPALMLAPRARARRGGRRSPRRAALRRPRRGRRAVGHRREARGAARVSGGLLQVRQAEEAAGRLPALLVDAERVAITVEGGVHGRRRAGQGDSFWEYRPIRPGEAASRIDWRRSARSGRSFVRETEWEAAQTVCLWLDGSARMGWRSGASLPRRSERASLLLLALASLLLRGGEHPRLLEAGAGLSPSFSGRVALERLGRQLMNGGGGERPAQHALPAHARTVLFSDFLHPIEETTSMLASLAAVPVTGVLVQVLDPAEVSLPFRGRIRFRGLAREGEVLASRAETLREAYADRLAAHQEALSRLCVDAGFRFTVHHTDQPPETALLALHTILSA